MAPEIAAEPAVVEPAPENVPPTLYVKNLNEKINVTEMAQLLRQLFGQHGQVVEVKMGRNVRMHGQAFVTFSSVEEAHKAMLASKDLYVFGKPLVCRWAREKSDVTAAEDGTLEEQKQKREAARDEKQRAFVECARRAEENSRAKQALMQAGHGGMFVGAHELMEPNKILFVQNLPREVGEAELQQLFSQYPGFREVRMVPGRTDIAFAEFGHEMEAIMVKEVLHDFQIVPEKAAIRVNFARK